MSLRTATTPNLGPRPRRGGAGAIRYRGETPAQHDARMQWWRDANFGIFIPWGVYAVSAGHYKGQVSPGVAEWIMTASAATKATAAFLYD